MNTNQDVRTDQSPTDDMLYRRLGREMIAAREGTAFSITVNGNSMSPAIRHADRLTIEPVQPDQLVRGDILLITRQDDFVTHRYLFADSEGYWLKGDNLLAPDAPVPADRIVGRVVNIRRCLRDVNPAAHWRKLANRCIGRLSELEFRAYLRYRKMYNNQSVGGNRFVRLVLASFRLPLYLLRFLSSS